MDKYLLGVRIDDIYDRGSKFYFDKFLKSNKFNMITPVNPEMSVIAKNNKDFNNILNQSELTVCDGTGISLMFLLKKRKIKKCQGSVLIYDLLDFAEKNKKKVFFLGTEDNVNRKARENLLKKYPSLKINGYSPPPYVDYPNNKFSKEEENKIISNIKRFKPDIVCAFFGAPFQETWFFENRKSLKEIGVKIGISLGGTAKFLSGSLKPVPFMFRKLDLEWLYRLIKDKNRFKRFITRIPLFVFLSFKEIFLD